MRRWLAILLVPAVLAGCAVRPSDDPSPQSPAPTATHTAEAVRVGSDNTPTGSLLAELYAHALAARGIPATVVDAPLDPAQLVVALADSEVVATPVFARTFATGLSLSELPPDADGIVASLAAALDGDVAVLRPSAVDAMPAYYVSQGKGDAPKLDALSQAGRLGKTASACLPGELAVSPNGGPALKGYGLAVTPRAVADAADRLAGLTAGTCSLAAFLPSEDPAGLAAMQQLADSKGLLQPDPQVGLLSPAAEKNDALVAALQALHAKLSNQELASLRLAAAAQGNAVAVDNWLVGHGLG